jgi:hypothetical protein
MILARLRPWHKQRSRRNVVYAQIDLNATLKLACSALYQLAKFESLPFRSRCRLSRVKARR